MGAQFANDHIVITKSVVRKISNKMSQNIHGVEYEDLIAQANLELWIIVSKNPDLPFALLSNALYYRMLNWVTAQQGEVLIPKLLEYQIIPYTVKQVSEELAKWFNDESYEIDKHILKVYHEQTPKAKETLYKSIIEKDKKANSQRFRIGYNMIYNISRQQYIEAMEMKLLGISPTKREDRDVIKDAL